VTSLHHILPPVFVKKTSESSEPGLGRIEVRSSCNIAKYDIHVGRFRAAQLVYRR
jgi:hypothetical protein